MLPSIAVVITRMQRSPADIGLCPQTHRRGKVQIRNHTLPQKRFQASLVRSSRISLHQPRVAAIRFLTGHREHQYRALAETINGLYKAEVIHRRGPWRSREAVEFATLEWVDWFNNRRLLEPIGNIPPAEAEERYYAMLNEPAMAA